MTALIHDFVLSGGKIEFKRLPEPLGILVRVSEWHENGYYCEQRLLLSTTLKSAKFDLLKLEMQDMIQKVQGRYGRRQ